MVLSLVKGFWGKVKKIKTFYFFFLECCMSKNIRISAKFFVSCFSFQHVYLLIILFYLKKQQQVELLFATFYC